MHEDPSVMIEEMERLSTEIKNPSNGFSTPSYIGLMLSLFIAMIYSRVGNTEKAKVIADDLVDTQINKYFGHMKNDMAIEPLMIRLNSKFD